MSVKTTMSGKLVVDTDTTQPVEGSRRSRDPVIQRRQATQAVIQRVLLIAPPILLALFLLASWFVAYRHVSNLILPAPGDTFSSLTAGIASGLFFSNALVTIEESLLGFALALVIALPLG
ncbi:MAG: hypothetical protein ACRDHW_23980, partial [Ktedonobacteraceae bacterium]